jgi:hypothetical protein
MLGATVAGAAASSPSAGLERPPVDVRLAIELQEVEGVVAISTVG